MRITFRCPPELIEVLPRPVAARDGLPEWLRAMPGEALVAELGGEVRTLKHCPPFIDAMRTGFLMPLAADVRVEAGAFSWDWDLPADRARPHHALAAQLPPRRAGDLGSPLHDPERVFLKFNNFWTIALEPGWSLLVVHPINRADLPFQTLTGLVDADRYGDGLIHFPARWLDAGFEGVLARGTPVAQCIPVQPRGAGAGVRAARRRGGGSALPRSRTRSRAEPGVYRKRYRAGRS